jgi:hypothetical protein
MGWAQHTAYDFRTGVAKEDIKVDCSRARPPGRPEATIVLSSATVFMRMSGNVARNGDDRRDAQPNDLGAFTVTRAALISKSVGTTRVCSVRWGTKGSLQTPGRNCRAFVA